MDYDVQSPLPKLLQVPLTLLHKRRWPTLSEEGKMIERDFDVSFVAAMALREKQIQQNYRPIIAVHKWFARRPGTLFRSLLLSEFAKGIASRYIFQGQ
jgi:hypothetical protein